MTNNTKSQAHTPGPWTIEEETEKYSFIGSDLDALSIRVGGNNNQTNARLIAAAPDLLAAAKLVYQEGFTDSYCGFCDRHAPKNEKGHIVGFLRHDGECIIEHLGIAIARAEGRAGA